MAQIESAWIREEARFFLTLRNRITFSLQQLASQLWSANHSGSRRFVRMVQLPGDGSRLKQFRQIERITNFNHIADHLPAFWHWSIVKFLCHKRLPHFASCGVFDHSAAIAFGLF
jgi:hypothetical protein